MHHRKKLRVTSAHYHANHLTSFWAARELGLFAQEGLSDSDWDLVYPGGVVPSEVEEEVLSSAMKEHGIDIVTDAKPGSVFCHVARGRELFIIGGWRTRSSKKALVGRTGLASLRDLAGKRVGTRDLGAEGDTYFAFQLRKIGMDPDRDVQWVRGIHSVSEAPDALKMGKVDAVVARSEALDNLQQQGFPILCNYPRGIPFRLIAATGQVLREYPDEVRAFLRGVIRGYWFYRTQPENFDIVKGAEIRLRQLAWDPEEQNIDRHMRYCTPEHFEKSPFPIDGGVSHEGLETYLEDVKYAGLVPKEFDLRQAQRFDLVREAFEELARRRELSAELARAQAVTAKYGL